MRTRIGGKNIALAGKDSISGFAGVLPDEKPG